MYVDHIRDAVNEELRRRGMSRYQLAMKMETDGVCSRSTVFKWLRGSNDTTTSVASECLSWLDLNVQTVRTPELQAR